MSSASTQRAGNADERKITIRAAERSDTAFVTDLAARFASGRPPWRGDEEVVAGTRRQLAAAFNDPRDADTILIAVDAGGERMGFAYAVTQRDYFTGEAHGHISEIVTVADGRGVGGSLMAACEAWSRGRGFRYLSLNVNDANESARRFYERRDYLPEYRHLVKLL